MKNGKSLNKKIGYLFFLSLVLGAIFIYKSKDNAGALFFPLGIMCSYLTIVGYLTKFKYNTEPVADSFYYLGFLFTLIALLSNLIPSFGEAETVITPQQTLKYFGIALSTTIFGLIGRIFLSHFFYSGKDEEDIPGQVDMEEAFLSMKMAAEDAANSIRKSVNTSTKMFAKLGEKNEVLLNKILNDYILSFEDFKNKMESFDSLDTLTNKIDTFDGLVELKKKFDSFDGIDLLNKKIASFTALEELNRRLSALAPPEDLIEKQVGDFFETVNKSVQKKIDAFEGLSALEDKFIKFDGLDLLEDKFNSFTALDTLIEKLESIDIPLGIIKNKINSLFVDLKEDVLKLSEGVSYALGELRTYVNKAGENITAINKMIESMTEVKIDPVIIAQIATISDSVTKLNDSIGKFSLNIESHDKIIEAYDKNSKLIMEGLNEDIVSVRKYHNELMAEVEAAKGATSQVLKSLTDGVGLLRKEIESA